MGGPPIVSGWPCPPPGPLLVAPLRVTGEKKQTGEMAYPDPYLTPWNHHHSLSHLYSLGLHFLRLSYSSIFTMCFSPNCVLHSRWLHLSQSPQGSRISGFIWIQWNFVGVLLAVFSAKGSWYWRMLPPNMFMTIVVRCEMWSSYSFDCTHLVTAH